VSKGYYQGSQGVNAPSYGLNDNKAYTSVSTFTDSFQSTGVKGHTTTLFQKINLLLGPLSTDLFASRLSSNPPVYVSWKPDPSAVATDADWNSLSGKLYANPLKTLIGRVLSLLFSQGIQELVYTSSTSLESPSVVSNAPANAGQSTSLIPQSPDTIQPVCQNNLPDIIL